MIVVNPSPKLTDQENHNNATDFGSSSQDQSIENNTKRILTHVLNSWNETSQVHTQVHVHEYLLKLYH